MSLIFIIPQIEKEILKGNFLFSSKMFLNSQYPVRAQKHILKPAKHYSKIK